MEAKQTPLINLLKSIPRDTVLVVEHDLFNSSFHPVGRLCHEAAAALRVVLAEVEKLRAEVDAQRAEIDQLREQLRLAQREPVAYISQEDFEFLLSDDMSEQYGTRQAPVFSRKDYRVSVPLYASPQPPARDVSALVEVLEDIRRRTAMTDRYESRATTHADNCWSWGPAHYGCAVREIERLQAEVEQLQADLAESDEIREKLGHLLKRIAAALKGEPPEGVWHSWHDLPEKATQLTAALRKLEERAQRDEALLRQAMEA